VARLAGQGVHEVGGFQDAPAACDTTNLVRTQGEYVHGIASRRNAKAGCKTQPWRKGSKRLLQGLAVSRLRVGSEPAAVHHGQRMYYSAGICHLQSAAWMAGRLDKQSPPVGARLQRRQLAEHSANRPHSFKSPFK